MKENEEYTKIIIIGEQAVGKSSLIMRYVDSDFDLNMIGTAGVDFRKKQINIEGKDINLMIFDTAGQQRFRAITKNFYRECQGVLLVYDVSDATSFANLKEWLASIKQHADEGVEILLVGNKIDLPRQVQADEGKQFSKESNVPLVETSAKTGQGVEKSFETLIRNIINNHNEKLKKSEKEKENSNIKVNIEEDDSKKKKKAGGCCSG
jgi:small GTP-binding protein